jgi:hypothetical protein
MPIIPASQTFDQRTLSLLLALDPLVQRYRTFFALFDWKTVPDRPLDPSRPGKRPHPPSAYVKALLLKVEAGFKYCTQLRRFLLDHPLLVLELGFRPVLDVRQPFGFDVERTVPTARWLREHQRTLEQPVLQALLAATVADLREEIPGLGEVVAFDVTHIYAFVQENNLRAYVKDRYDKAHQPKGDRDCQLGVKKSTNKEQADGSKKEEKEYLWGYGSGVVSATDPVYGDVVLAEYTQPFNENDITYFFPLYIRTVAILGFFPTHLSADAAFDAWYVYEVLAHRHGMAAIPLNTHGHPESRRAADGVPLCEKGLRMHPTYQFSHTYGYCSQRFRCPLLFPAATGQSCDHAQFAKGKGCVKDLNWELGGQMRVTLDRDGPLYHAVYNQRTSTERLNSQSKELGIKRPTVRNIASIRTLNTLTYLVMNARALRRVRHLNTGLLTTPLRLAA